MTDERDEQQAPFEQHFLDTKTGEVVSAIVAAVCIIGCTVIVVASVMGWLPQWFVGG